MIGTGAAILGSALIGGGTALFGASQSASASRSAASAQVAAADRASATQLQMYNQTRGDLQPFMQAGMGAQNQLSRLYGLNGGRPDFSGFTQSPDYQFTFDEGQRALNRQLGARGQLISGNALKAATRFGQGMASQQFGNYFDRLLRMTSVGQSAAAGTASAGMGAANGMAGAQMGAGNAQAAGIVGGANAWNGALGIIGGQMNAGTQNMMLNNYLTRQPTQTASGYGNNIGDFNPNVAGGFFTGTVT